MKLYFLVLFAIPGASTSAQSFNVDFGPQGNNSLPSATYGAASGQTGFWNPVRPFGALRDLGGSLTTANIGASVTTSQVAFAGAGADDLALMRDYFESGVLLGDESAAVSFTGLQAGQYRCYVYGWNPSPNSPGIGQYRMWDGQLRQLNFNSTWPGQQVNGQTYFTQDFSVANSSQLFQIHLIGLGTDAVPAVSVMNGLQIVMLPSPGTAGLLGLAALGVFRGRRR